MKDKEFLQLGIPHGEAIAAARNAVQAARHAGLTAVELRRLLRVLVRNPAQFADHQHLGGLAQILAAQEKPAVAPYPTDQPQAPFQQWGAHLEEESIQQMRNACALPVSVRGALMPDAHVGYGLPIGGVLATKNAVIPYAVGVDIACRMKLTVLDLPLSALSEDADRLKKAIEAETRFGVGAEFKKRRQHDVMDHNWTVSPVTKSLKDKAWAQLGTSGSGNHFVEFGLLEVQDAAAGLQPGQYVALLSHSGSRGSGAQVCTYYSKAARNRHRMLAPHLQHLAWLDLDTEAGQEYWAAMNLMGEYAAANHACIHRAIAMNLGRPVLLDLENHHNFAWKEVHDGQEVIVHRKGATPAGAGVLGIIPGTMATPGYVVRGRGNPASLNSAAHGAGRVMSRTRARKSLNWKAAHQFLKEQGVTLLSAGLDEVPMVYKNIQEVMAAQSDLVETLAMFHPRLVKMAPAGERPED